MNIGFEIKLSLVKIVYNLWNMYVLIQLLERK